MAPLTRWLPHLPRKRSSPPRPPAGRRPRVESLEERLAPAWDVTVAAAVTANMTVSTSGGTRTFTATASGANVNVVDIQTALLAGENVSIKTGTTGAETGNLTWAPGANLDFDGAVGSLALSLQAAGSVEVLSALLDSAPVTTSSLSFLVQAGPTGNITVNSLSNLATVTLTAGSTQTATLGSISAGLDNLTVDAATILLQDDIALTAGAVTLDGAVFVDNSAASPLTTISAPGGVALTGTLNGAAGNALSILALNAAVTLGGTVGGGTPLNDLTVVSDTLLVQGDITLNDPGATATLDLQSSTTFGPAASAVTLGGTAGAVSLAGQAHAITASLTITSPNTTDTVQVAAGTLSVGVFDLSTNATLVVGNGLPSQPATLAGIGTVTAAAVTVGTAGVIAPAGVGVSGVLTLVAPVTFDAGSFYLAEVDALLSDLLAVTGSVTLNTGAGIDGSGTPGANPLTVLTTTGTLTGTFSNEANGVVVVGNDAFTTTYTQGPPGSLVLTLAPTGPATVTGATASGSLYTVKLLGGGTAGLIVVDAGDGSPIDLVVRAPTTKNTLQITVAGNGGTGLLAVDALRIGGSIGAVTATTTNLVGAASVSGLLTSLNVATLTGSLIAGGAATQTTTSIVAREITGDLTLGSKLTALTTSRLGDADSLTPATITVPYLGTLTTTVNAAFGLVGDACVDLVINAGPTTAVALASMKVAGRLVASTLDVRGRVGTVTVARDVTVSTIGTTTADARYPNQLSGITSFTATGRIEDTAFAATGTITTLTGGSILQGSIQAATLGTLTTKANPALGVVGDFSSDVVLNAGAPFRTALTRATIGGSMTGATWDVQGAIVTLTVGRNVTNSTVGTTSPFAQNPNQLGSLTTFSVGGTVNTSSVTLVGRLSASSSAGWSGSSLTAGSIGTLTVLAKAGFASRFADTTVTVTSFAGAGTYAINSVSIAGVVSGSTFLVQTGNVQAFTCGSFVNSTLLLGYTPGGSITTPGTFTHALTLASFRTTMTYTGGLAATLAFSGGSQVVATRFGTIRLSGVNTDNGGNAFGLRCNGAANRGSVQVTASSPDAIPTGNLTPNLTAGDFNFLA